MDHPDTSGFIKLIVEASSVTQHVYQLCVIPGHHWFTIGSEGGSLHAGVETILEPL